MGNLLTSTWWFVWADYEQVVGLPSWCTVPGVTVTGGSRRQQYSATTKRALIDVAEELFTENGYAATSLDAIVAGAEVTKARSTTTSAASRRSSRPSSSWSRPTPRGPSRRRSRDTRTRGRRRPPACSHPHRRAGARYRRIVIQEGPSVLGYERFPQREALSTRRERPRDGALGPGSRQWDLGRTLTQTFTRSWQLAM